MKKLITLIVALMAIATSAYSFVLEVDGYSVTADNGYNIPSSDIHFDVATMTLTIENLQSSRSGACIYAADFGTDELKIVVNGSCSLVSYSEEALYIENSNVTVTGSGKLSLESKEKAAIVVGSNSKLVFSDADVVASGCGVIKGASGAENNSVVIDRSKFVGSNDGSGNASIEGLADFTLDDAEFDDVTFQYEEEYNAPCTFYGTSFYFDKTAGSLCYNGQYLNEDYETTAPYNDVWYYGFSLKPKDSGSGVKDYGFEIEGDRITSKNYQSASNGRAWSYVPEANVLHLKEGSLWSPYQTTVLTIYGDINPTLNIQVDGHCQFNNAFKTAIQFVGNGTHTISGSGTLDLHSTSVNPYYIVSDDGLTNLTIQDITLNMKSYGEGAVGFRNTKFGEIVLKQCEINITTDYIAWFGNSSNLSVNPVLKYCYLDEGRFEGGGALDDSRQWLKELHIKRMEQLISELNVTVPEPIPGTIVSGSDCQVDNEYCSSVELLWSEIYNDGSSKTLHDGDIIKEEYQYKAVVLLYLNNRAYFFADESELTATINGHQATVYIAEPYMVGIFYTFSNDSNPTGIKGVHSETTTNHRHADSQTPLYNLNGQRVSDNYHGIVIKQGRKVVNK